MADSKERITDVIKPSHVLDELEAALARAENSPGCEAMWHRLSIEDTRKLLAVARAAVAYREAWLKWFSESRGSKRPVTLTQAELLKATAAMEE